MMMTPAELQTAASFFSQQPDFCGFWLGEYATREGLTPDALAAHLGCSVEGLQRLCLCRYPRPERWEEDVRDLAARYGCDPARLSRALAVADWNGNFTATPGDPGR